MANNKTKKISRKQLVHQVRDWFSGAAAYFGWMREAKRENTRCGLRPMSDKAASQKTRSPEGCDENGLAAALLLSHVSIQICSLVAPCRRPILIATPLNQSRTWCTSEQQTDQARYIVQAGDTLFSIAQKVLGDGNLYAEIRNTDGTRPSPAQLPRATAHASHSAPAHASHSAPASGGTDFRKYFIARELSGYVPE
jgi:hypothetical protein